MKFRHALWILPFFLVACASTDEGAGTKMDKKVQTTKEETKKKDAVSGDSKEKEAAAGTVTCTLGKDVRTINRALTDGGGCEVVYTSKGEAKTVADAKNDLSYCDKVVEKIQGNLSGAGYKCE